MVICTNGGEQKMVMNLKATDPRLLRPPSNLLRLPAAGNLKKLEKAVAVLLTTPGGSIVSDHNQH
jgi:hypothetical protein